MKYWFLAFLAMLSGAAYALTGTSPPVDIPITITAPAGGAAATVVGAVSPATTPGGWFNTFNRDAEAGDNYELPGVDPGFSTADTYPKVVLLHTVDFASPSTGNTCGPPVNYTNAQLQAIYHSAATGGCDAAWETVFSTATGSWLNWCKGVTGCPIYYWRLESEGPGQEDSATTLFNAGVPVSDYQAGLARIIHMFRAHPEFNNVKIEMDGPGNSTGHAAAYYPTDAQLASACNSIYGNSTGCKLDLGGYNVYFRPQFDATLANEWAYWLGGSTSGLNFLYNFHHAQGHPLAYGEWCDTYDDNGSLITQFSDWAKTHDTAIMIYWNTNSAISTGSFPNGVQIGCILGTRVDNGASSPNTANVAAFKAEWGNTAFSGNSSWPTRYAVPFHQ